VNIKILKTELAGVEKQLERIADLLEGILGATDPIPANMQDFPEDSDTERVFYTDERREIVEYHVNRLGREFRERGLSTTKK
jgi:hypothetical protein